MKLIGTRDRLLRPPVEEKLVRGFQGMDVGRRIRIQLIHTDVEQGFTSRKLDDDFLFRGSFLTFALHSRLMSLHLPEI